MRKVSAGGVGALAFLVLVIIAVAIARPSGGTYKASDVAKYLTRGHRPAAIASLYIMALAVVGLLFLLRRLREALAGQRATVFWGLSIAGAAAIVAGFAMITAVPIAMGVAAGASSSHRQSHSRSSRRAGRSSRVRGSCSWALRCSR